ncbi:prepilin-type N-terminal cleavage/methylation domain-containing protein, partial [Candidatus Uhrbacteria bacterium]|nr:prepilin-type N-terminal cleavage/methylation domain-containing protein [Candidatus Uhrbacteria bacterium]
MVTQSKRGFTLIELLIVIGILAVLAAAVVIVLNPAELLAQARDGTRISDLNNIQGAVSLYLSDVTSPTLGTTARSTASSSCGFGTCTVTASYGVDGTGWVEVNLTAISTGSTLSNLPRDPTNNANYQYAYKGDN